MFGASRISSRPFVVVQVAGILLVFATLDFSPPATGRMILIPLDRGPTNILPFALAHGAALVGRGPFAGSVVVYGHRNGGIASMLYHRHILMIAAPYAGCGAAA